MQAVLAGADQEAARTTLEEIDRVLVLNRARYVQGELSGRTAPPAGRAVPIRGRRVRGRSWFSRNARSALLALLDLRPLDQPFETADGSGGWPHRRVRGGIRPGRRAGVRRAARIWQPRVESGNRRRPRFGLQQALGPRLCSIGGGVSGTSARTACC